MLNLSDKRVQGGVGSLGECVNLLHLDLSKNRITMLSGLENCISLKILDLSYNKLMTFDALKGCEALERLDLQGNLVKDLKPIERISGALTKLTNLYLQEFNGEGANPCCNSNSYRKGVISFFPNLLSLDG